MSEKKCKRKANIKFIAPTVLGGGFIIGYYLLYQADLENVIFRILELAIINLFFVAPVMFIYVPLTYLTGQEERVGFDYLLLIFALALFVYLGYLVGKIITIKSTKK